MNADTLYIIKVIFGVIAAIFALSTAIFTFVDTAQNEKTENTQAWFRGKWEAVNNSRWLSLPENSTRWLLNSRIFLSELIHQLTDKDITIQFLLGSIPILLFIACFIYWGQLIAFLSLIFSFPLLISAISRNLANKIFETSKYYIIAVVAVSGLLTAFLWLQIILNLNLYYAALIMIVFIPFFWIAAFLPLIAVGELTNLRIVGSREDAIAVFLVGVAGGFTATLLALLVGHIIEPSAYVPQTLQMLISNVMFDGLTMALTFTILSKALSKDGLLRLPVAILLDVLVAAIFAICSLYFGLVFTDKAIGLRVTIYILFARSADNTHFELSPYFWVMHTTFIPTLLYLCMILFCWASKALLIPVRWFFGLGQANKNPLKLTAGLCGIFAAIFTILFFGANSVHERAKDLKLNQDQQIRANFG